MYLLIENVAYYFYYFFVLVLEFISIFCKLFYKYCSMWLTSFWVQFITNFTWIFFLTVFYVEYVVRVTKKLEFKDTLYVPDLEKLSENRLPKENLPNNILLKLQFIYWNTIDGKNNLSNTKRKLKNTWIWHIY